MKLTLFGATGRTGSIILKKALKDGHQVTALTRQQEKLYEELENLTVVEGNILSKDKVRDAVKGADAVIVTIGADDISKPIKMISEGTKNVLEAMEEFGVKRLIQLASGGLLDHPSGKYKGEVDYPPFLQYVFSDHLRAYKAIKASDIDWTIVCPNMMPEGRETGDIKISENTPPEEAKPVPVGDVAALMYKILKDNLYIKTRVGVAA